MRTLVGAPEPPERPQPGFRVIMSSSSGNITLRTSATGPAGAVTSTSFNDTMATTGGSSTWTWRAA